MRSTPMWRRYLRFWGADVHADVEAELAFHVEELTERLVREGADPADARREAVRRFGDYARIRAACVEIDCAREQQRRWRQLVADLWQDLRVGVRTLSKSPGFTIPAVGILGLGVGAATVVLSVVNALFVRPLPFPEPDRIVSVVRRHPFGVSTTHPQGFVAFLRDESRAFSAAAGIGVSPGVNLVSEAGSTYISNLEVTSGYFQVFGVQPRLGRPFLRDDESDQATVVLSHAVWVGHFDGDSGIIGEVVRLGGQPHTVVGIMPSDFRSFDNVDAWTPFRLDPLALDQNYRLVGRLAPGWTAPQAEAELRALAAGLNAQLPDGVRAEERLGVQSHRDVLATEHGGTVWPLTAAVGVMLLVVCANAAGLQLARTVGRRRELAVRAALGGGRGRLLRQLLTEGVLLSVAGGAVGVAAAALGVRGLVALQPRIGAWDVTLDAVVLFGSLGIALAVSVVFGLLPGLLTVRNQPADALHGGHSRSVTTAGASRMRRSLVVFQVALCSTLLIAAGGFLRTFVGLSTSQLGFDPANVLTARASLQGPGYQSADAVSALYRRTLGALAQLPGVEAAAVTNNLPVERGLNLGMRHRPDNVSEPAIIDWRYIAGDYLRVLRIPLVAGREFNEADHRAAGPPVALVNEAFARQFGGGREVIGARIQPTAIEVDDQMREIVGVLGDVRTRGVTATRPTVLVPVEQVPDDLLGAAHGFFQVSWALRTRGGGTDLIQSVERVFREADPLLPITAFRTMGQVVGGALAPIRFRTLLLTLFAAAAVTLAAAGLYGVVAYAVAQRTKEIAIRLALGASGRQLVARFTRHGIVLAAAGGVVGVAAAALFNTTLRRVTPDAQSLDPGIVAAVVVILAAVSVVATIVPARRAMRVDPVAVLKTE